jgi:hypothetical protein
MEKKSFEFTKIEPENVEIVFQDKLIEVRPVLHLAEQAQIIENYIQNRFFAEPSLYVTGHDILGAEHALRLDIIQLLTNINVKEEDISVFLYGELWYEVVSAIENYSEFEDILEETVEDVIESLALKSSVGSVLESLSAKVSAFLDKISVIAENLKPEDLDKIKELVGSLGEQLKAPAVSAIVEDMSRGKQ